jgi:hypothetical protein
MHEPWRHRSGLYPYVGVVSHMPADQNADLFWICGALARHSLRPAVPTTQIAVIFRETSNPTKPVIDESPMVRITRHAARIAALSADQEPTATIGSPNMTMPIRGLFHADLQPSTNSMTSPRTPAKVHLSLFRAQRGKHEPNKCNVTP